MCSCSDADRVLTSILHSVLQARCPTWGYMCSEGDCLRLNFPSEADLRQGFKDMQFIWEVILGSIRRGIEKWDRKVQANNSGCAVEHSPAMYDWGPLGYSIEHIQSCHLYPQGEEARVFTYPPLTCHWSRDAPRAFSSTSGLPCS